jgi:hypothetical protein
MIDLGTGNNNKMCVASSPCRLHLTPPFVPVTGLWITSRRYADVSSYQLWLIDNVH